MNITDLENWILDLLARFNGRGNRLIYLAMAKSIAYGLRDKDIIATHSERGLRLQRNNDTLLDEIIKVVSKEVLRVEHQLDSLRYFRHSEIGAMGHHIHKHLSRLILVNSAPKESSVPTAVSKGECGAGEN